MKTIVYVDGFNLYYRALQRTSPKWLNLEALCKSVLPVECKLTAIYYYTTPVSGRRRISSPKDQNTFLRALKTLPNLQIHLGNFQVSKKWMFLAQPVDFRPVLSVNPQPNPTFPYVVKTEEKGSDVNLGAHLVRDAFTGSFEHAAILTDDTDLKEPLRIVVEEAKLTVTLLTPVDNPAGDLKKLATHLRHIMSLFGDQPVSQSRSRPQRPDPQTIGLVAA